MNKMVVNHLDKLFVTSDAATIIRELEVGCCVFLLRYQHFCLWSPPPPFLSLLKQSKRGDSN